MMTLDQQRIAIAEWMGFYDFTTKTVLSGETFTIAKLKDGIKHPFDWTPWADGRYSIPEYPEDLNAMHEAEKKLHPTDKDTIYVRNLEKLISHCDIDGAVFLGGLISATSQQRSEALCRVLWPERFD